MTLRESIEVRIHCGIHSRIGVELVKIAESTGVAIQLTVNDRSVDCRCILEVLSLALTRGSYVRVGIKGKAAEKAMSSVRKLLQGEADD